MLGRRLQKIGVGVTCLGLLTVAFRVWFSGSLLPNDFMQCALFSIAELYLLPLGVLLVLMGWRLRHSRRHSFLVRLPAGLVVALLAAGGFAVSYFGVSPLVGRLLEWGRYGVGPPVQLSRIEEVSAVTSLAFPPGSRLLDGKHQGGMNPILVAKIALPRSEVDRFLAQSPFEGQASSQTKGAYISWGQGALLGYQGEIESIDHFLAASGQPGDNWMEYVNAIVDLDKPGSATLYVVWYIL